MSLSVDRPPGGWIEPVPSRASWAGKNRGWNIRSTTTTIGRGDECDVQIRDAKVSRVHAELTWDKKDLYLTHRSTTNDTLLMGLPIPRDKPQKLLNSISRIELADGIELDVQVYAAVPDAATVPGQPLSRLAAIVFADAAGFSRGMETDQKATRSLLRKCHQICLKHTRLNGGQLINWPGDSILILFDSVVRALNCAIASQTDLHNTNAEISPEMQMLFRFGITSGEVEVIEDDETGGHLAYGDAINLAARLQEIAEPGEIVASDKIRDYVEGHKNFALEFKREYQPKRMKKKVSVYRVSASSNVK